MITFRHSDFDDGSGGGIGTAAVGRFGPILAGAGIVPGAAAGGGDLVGTPLLVLARQWWRWRRWRVSGGGGGVGGGNGPNSLPAAAEIFAPVPVDLAAAAAATIL